MVSAASESARPEGGRADADDLVQAAALVPALVQAGEQAGRRGKDADGYRHPECKRTAQRPRREGRG